MSWRHVHLVCFKQRVIDVLKLDIESNEWSCIKTMVREGVMTSVRQLVFEMHTPEVFMVGRQSSREDYADMYATLHLLEEHGFRRFHIHYNHMGQFISTRSGKHRTCCYEISYININFLQLPTRWRHTSQPWQGALLILVLLFLPDR